MKKVILTILVVICVCILTIWAVNSFTSTSVASTSVASTFDASNSVVSAIPTNKAATTSTSNSEVLGGKAEIVIGSGSGTGESTIMIPISVKTVPTKGIGSFNFNIKYDREILEVVEVTPGDAVGNNTSNLDYSIIDTTGLISFLFTSSNNGKDSITKPGVITNVKFKIKKDADKGVTKLTKGTAGAFGDVALNKINTVFTEGEIIVNK